MYSYVRIPPVRIPKEYVHGKRLIDAGRDGLQGQAHKGHPRPQQVRRRPCRPTLGPAR